MCAVEARDDMHEGLKPQAELWDRRGRGRIEGGLFDVKLVDKRVVRLAIALSRVLVNLMEWEGQTHEGFLLQSIVHKREVHVLPESFILFYSGVRGDGSRWPVEQDRRG